MNLWHLFVSSISSSALVLALLWLAREWIKVRLTKSVEHEFNAKLEGVRSEFRAAEERLRSNLREREAELSALRSGALTALASRQSTLDKRRLEAVEQIWKSFNSLGRARVIAQYMAVLKYDACAERAKKDPKFREFIASIGGDFDPKTIDYISAATARPFVSEIVWAVYSAIQAVIGHSVIVWMALKSGMDGKDIADSNAVKRLIVAVLPHSEGTLEKLDETAWFHVLEALDNRLLTEMRNMLSGVETDKETLDMAAEIIRKANELQAPATPGGEA